MKKILSVAGILLAFFVIFNSYSASAQEAAAVDSASATASGGLKKAIFLSETGTVGNNSDDDWKNAFNKDVTLGGTNAQCIEIKYTGEVKDETNALAFFTVQFRATVDGNVAKGGAPYFDAPFPYSYTLAAMNWWVCGLTPGAHTVKVQFRPYYGADKAVVRNRTLIIEYNQ
jgi:hypothetical protein